MKHLPEMSFVQKQRRLGRIEKLESEILELKLRAAAYRRIAKAGITKLYKLDPVFAQELKEKLEEV